MFIKVKRRAYHESNQPIFPLHFMFFHLFSPSENLFQPVERRDKRIIHGCPCKMTRKNARSGNLAVRRPHARLLRLQESLCAVRCDSKYRYKSHSCFYTSAMLSTRVSSCVAIIACKFGVVKRFWVFLTCFSSKGNNDGQSGIVPHDTGHPVGFRCENCSKKPPFGGKEREAGTGLFRALI